MKYGSYSTIDAPTKKQGEALKYLQKEIGKIGGRIWKKQNPHDLGSYPSFEIDMPEKFKFVDIDLDCTCGECEDCLLVIEYDKWVDQANKIEAKYNKKFEQYL